MTKIKKYLAYFHDGGVIDIQHGQNEVVFSLESAEMDLDDFEDDIPLSKYHTIRGKLHLKGIKSIFVNGTMMKGTLEKIYDMGDIGHLEIKEHKVRLTVNWDNFRPKPWVNDFSNIEIEATEIYWETIPDLLDPFG